ncbi:MAG: efflux RND transporter periplasmic adaptor subunit [Muribaculaceae bacterium]|nr:efflux RND transporter periplasmic adaptor subunit [Muribaculaceae bacterium]MDE6119507.1 efflux RND transporter periplasmic adaptor subunit [Muribaculaceae bacterium]
MAENQQANAAASKKKSNSIFLCLAIIIFGVLVLAIAGFLFMTPPAEIIEGQADATSVRVSGKLPGRVVEFYVSEGDNVRKGDTLVHIHSSLAEAKLAQAEGMQTVAESTNEKVDAGTRKQIINSAYELWMQAQAAATITQKTFDRMDALCKEGVVSEQKRDEAKAAYDAAAAAERAARSQYEMAKDGAQREDKKAAAAMVNVAKGGVAEVEALLEDSYLVAPCDGQIETIYPHVGELVSLGAPIMSVLRLDDKWVTFNVREEYLENLTMGKEIDIMIPALGRKEAKARIFYIADLGSYATWRATKSTGDWDSRTFQIKARTIDSIPDLRPGMSIIYLDPNDK